MLHVKNRYNVLHLKENKFFKIKWIFSDLLSIFTYQVPQFYCKIFNINTEAILWDVQFIFLLVAIAYI